MDTPQEVNREERDMFDRIYATTYHIKMTDDDRNDFVRSAVKLAKELVAEKKNASGFIKENIDGWKLSGV